MPTYTYRCKNCGKTQDEFHAISAKPRIKCNECGGPCKKTLGTGAGVIFKGSGFYETDYKRSNKSSTDKSEAGNGKSESKSDSSGSTKPAGAGSSD